ncbi:MFS transporter [Photobacterium sanctipauli]|uniref:MFS transporter n=2 Tax=Photobacterium sanctipauli TaxID=1342794 RepID=A0A2T3NUV6_9GAMM|nr:MFS transporter [Photobacterium sanctipauli]
MWKNTTYVKLLSAQIVSLLGTGISSITLALLAWDLAEENASAVLGTAFAIKMIAYVGLAPIFGAIAHKLPRKAFMFGLDIVRAGLILCLPFVTQAWEVYVLVFCINACSAGFTPLFQSTLPQVLPDREQYVKALSYSRLAYDLEQIISPLIAAALLMVISFRGLFIFDACTFLVSGLLILFCILPVSLPVEHGKGVWNNLKFGIQSYLQTPSLRALWIAYLAASGASAMVIVNTVVYINEVLAGGDKQTALAMAIVGLGSMVVAFKLPTLLDKFDVRTSMIAGTAAITISLLFMSALPMWFGFAIACFVLGMGMSCIQTPAGLLITRSCSEQDSASYFAANFSLSHLWWLFTYLIAGWSSAVLGLSHSYLLMGLLSAISLLLVVCYFPKQGKRLE